MRSAADEVLALLEGSARNAYFGEAVTQLEHALQCAQLAEQSGANDELTVACLLHDVGHLIGVPASEVGVPNRDDVGALFLRDLGFSERLCALIGSHVDAKLYLTATNPGYVERLSPASVKTLELQGGPMTPEQATTFAADPLLRDKLRLRSWDEQAKIPGAPVPALETYRSKIEEALQT